MGDSDLQGGDEIEVGNWGAFEEKWAIRGRLKKSGRLGGSFEKRSNKNKLRACKLFVKKICLNIQNISEVNKQKFG